MNKDDEFRQRAAEAQEYADRAVSPVDRDGWLKEIEMRVTTHRHHLKHINSFKAGKLPG